MDTAEWLQFALDYLRTLIDAVKALSWPIVVAIALWVFRSPIVKKLEDLTEAEGLGFKTTFAAGARRAEAEAVVLAASEASPITDEATLGARRNQDHGLDGLPTGDREGTWSGTPSDTLRRWESLTLASRTFERLRKFAVRDPNAAVLEAFSELQLASLEAWHLLYPQEPPPVPDSARPLAGFLDLDAGFQALAADLTELRTAVAHNRHSVSAESALSYIAACESLTEAVISKTTSMLRHPSRSQRLKPLIDRD